MATAHRISIATGSTIHNGQKQMEEQNFDGFILLMLYDISADIQPYLHLYFTLPRYVEVNLC